MFWFSAEKPMITLYSYPELFGVADNNGYGLKVFAFLRLNGMPFKHEHGAWTGSSLGIAPPVPKTPVLLDEVERAGNHMRSSASAGTTLRVTASPTRFFGGTMTKRNRTFFEEGTLETCLRNQDDEFCRRLRIAVEMGMESCPTTVSREPCTKRPISNYTRPN
jgi:hypothetical protein